MQRASEQRGCKCVQELEKKKKKLISPVTMRGGRTVKDDRARGEINKERGGGRNDRERREDEEGFRQWQQGRSRQADS